jgi:hypothetical protein
MSRAGWRSTIRQPAVPCLSRQGSYCCRAWHALISAVVYMSLELHFIQIEIAICGCGKPVDLPIRAL